MSFLTTPLNSLHKKADFSCGSSLLDNYLHHQASQDVRRKLAACFVLYDNANSIIKGYYTLSNNSIPGEMIPENFSKNLPKAYSDIPTILLGRLAVDTKFKAQGIGRLLLVDALKRCALISKNIGSFAVVGDPLDVKALGFYLKFGFILLPDSGKMFLPMKTIQLLFKE